MSLRTAPDVPLLVTVPSTSRDGDRPPQLSAERRISPSWTVSQLRAKLEPVTGIPPSSQDLRIRALDGSWSAITGDGRQIGEWSLRRGGEIEVHDTRPPTLDPTTSTVEKYTMPASQYEQLSDSVLHWKRTRQLGRFDPSAKSPAQLSAERAVRDDSEIKGRGIEVGRRCRVGGEDGRRGVVGFVGAVEGLGGERERWARWVGVVFDEPVGRNDGSVTVRVTVKVGGGEEGEQEEQEERKVRLFECKPGFGVLARPEKVEVGEEWAPLDDLEVDEDMQEL